VCGVVDWSYRIPWAIAVAAALLALWALLSGGTGWLYGVPAALIGAGIGAWLAPGSLHRPRPFAILRFMGLFLVNSLRGGADVAWRALHPAMPMAPTWTDYPLRLHTPAGRALFLVTVSLMPGTLAADLRNGTVRVHVLTPEMAAGLPQLEQAVASIFGDETREAGT